VALVVAGAALTFGYQALRPSNEGDKQHQAPPVAQPMPTGDPLVTTTIPLGPKEMAGGIAAADGSVWVGVRSEDGSSPQVVRIDQATNKVVARIDVGAIPWRGKISASASGVWIASDGVLQRIDPETDQVTTVASFPDKTITAIAAAEGSVWAVVVQDSGSTNDVNAWVMHVDLSADPATTQIPLDSRAVGYDDQITISGGDVWVSGKELVSEDTERGGPIVRIDATTNEVVSTWDVNAFDFVVAGDVVLVRTVRDGVFDNHPNPEQWQVDRYDADTGDRIGEASRASDGDLNGSLGADQSVMWGVGTDDAGNARMVRSDVATLAVEAHTEPLPSLFHDAVLDSESSTAWISAMNEVVRIDIGREDTIPSDEASAEAYVFSDVVAGPSRLSPKTSPSPSPWISPPIPIRESIPVDSLLSQKTGPSWVSSSTIRSGNQGAITETCHPEVDIDQDFPALLVERPSEPPSRLLPDQLLPRHCGVIISHRVKSCTTDATPRRLSGCLLSLT
jgi:hypothetical protein